MPKTRKLFLLAVLLSAPLSAQIPAPVSDLTQQLPLVLPVQTPSAPAAPTTTTLTVPLAPITETLAPVTDRLRTDETLEVLGGVTAPVISILPSQVNDALQSAPLRNTLTPITSVLPPVLSGLVPQGTSVLGSSAPCQLVSAPNMDFDFGLVRAGQPSAQYRQGVSMRLFCQRPGAYRVVLVRADGEEHAGSVLPYRGVDGQALVLLTLDGQAIGTPVSVGAPGLYEHQITAEPRQADGHPVTPQTRIDWAQLGRQYRLQVRFE